MNRLGAPWIALALLVLGGIAFGWLASRATELHERDLERQAEDRARRDLDRLVARVPGRASDPKNEPLERWTFASPADVDPRVGASETDLLALAEAELAERRAEDRSRALAIYASIARRAAGPIAQLAALRAGTTSARNDPGAARVWFEQAAEAASDVADPGGIRVRLAARYHLANLDLDAGRTDQVDAFLDEVGDGHVLEPGAVVSRRDLIASLESRLRDVESSEVGTRLAEASWRAQVVDSLLPELDQPGAVHVALDHLTPVSYTMSSVVFVYVRRQDSIERHLFDDLMRPDEDGMARVAHVGTHQAVVGELDHVFTGQLDGVVAYARPEPTPATPFGAEVALWAGFAIYAFGAWLAFVALRRSARAAAMQGDFVAAVSHELKTPIASVRAMAEMLAQGNPTPERTHQYAERMALEMQRLGNTVRNVLDAAQIERQGHLAITRQVEDPAAFVARVGETARPALESAGVSFELAPTSGEQPIAFDSDAMTGALVNLLENAAKFDREQRQVALRGEPTSSGYRFVVEDRGPGVPASERATLFARFKRGAEARRGAVPGIGLGLYVVKQVAEAHGGTVSVEDRDGGGARFAIEIPGGTT